MVLVWGEDEGGGVLLRVRPCLLYNVHCTVHAPELRVVPEGGEGGGGRGGRILGINI